MSKKEKLSRTKATADNLSNMPKVTAGQRVKYLLKKNGMTQRDLAKRMYGDEVTEAQIINLNAKINDSEHRHITPKDAQLMSEIFNVFSQFILEGGYENNADMIKHALSEVEAQTDLLHLAFRSLSSLSGYNVVHIGYRGQEVEEIVSSIYEYASIEHDGKVISLTQGQLFELENIIYEHAEIAIRRYIEANGKEVR